MRIANHIPFLREHGIELSHRATLSADEYALLRSEASPAKKAAVLALSALRAPRHYPQDDLLMIHRLLTLTPAPLLYPPSRLDVYDFDDALLVGSPGESNRLFQWAKQEARRARLYMRRARLVLAANTVLASEANQIARRVEIVPSCVDPAGQPMHTHEDREPCTIGWIGSHTTLPYLRPVLPIIERLNRSRRRARLVVVGGDTGLRASWIEHRRWSLESQAADLATFDVGLMPLPDDPWTRGKAGYKLLQYFAAGVPAIASPVGVNAELLRRGSGLAATTADDWERGLIELISDPYARSARGTAARAFVEQHYSYRRWAPELASLLRSLVA